MKQLVASIVAFVTLVVAGPCVAADYNWGGFYIGGNAGYGWGRADSATTIADGLLANCHFCDNVFLGGPTVDHLVAQDAGSPRLKPQGFTGGAQLGYNWQAGHWVYGAEFDINASSQRDTINNSFVLPGNTALAGGGGVCGATGPETCIGNFSTTLKTEWLLTIRPRIGYAWGRTLAYTTAGLAVTRLKFSQTYTDNITYPLLFPPSTGAGGSERASASANKLGFTLGGGFEQAIADNWSMKAEYLYVRFNGVDAAGGLTDGFGGAANFANKVDHLSSSIVRVGLNYRIGGRLQGLNDRDAWRSAAEDRSAAAPVSAKVYVDLDCAGRRRAHRNVRSGSPAAAGLCASRKSGAGRSADIAVAVLNSARRRCLSSGRPLRTRGRLRASLDSAGRRRRAVCGRAARTLLSARGTGAIRAAIVFNAILPNPSKCEKSRRAGALTYVKAAKANIWQTIRTSFPE